ncbi:MAG: 50S ribosomal protein L6 [Planctomycetes bacterium]|nr:50S ribosomal protein L6 [Planctomycetota bacterium]
MSRVGKTPIAVPGGVNVKIAGRNVTVGGSKGTLSWTFPISAAVTYDAGAELITVTRRSDQKQDRANHGLTRALIANMVEGVSRGFERRLEIYGTGYSAKLVGKALHLSVGFMGRRRGLGAQFEIPVPAGIEVEVEREAARGDSEPARLVIRGCDKQLVGRFTAEIRALRKTEPYKGKGIRYQGEHVRRKQGKALAGAGS